ncbi:conserved protein of unknown function [Rhodovastum atsumiense]|uniref:Uncharacterized protein n=1 Tax=Rhodovastum atsumiense TaxID=504468 RepID=A0A5M6IQM8_9PROT|nr:hypothetical protein [Rhodovastum atsumiense]KAA5610580.1 hypothetical protein F1189_18295 [Rhodovastum atsumiense]CAH2600692.1 conserved protein of unknown function [Rhodovastum atsumiense]
MTVKPVLVRLVLATTALVVLWTLSWGAQEALDDLTDPVLAVVDRLVQDPILNSRIGVVLDFLYEIAQATIAVFWILGTLVLVIGAAWAVRTGGRRPRLTWR